MLDHEPDGDIMIGVRVWYWAFRGISDQLETM